MTKKTKIITESAIDKSLAAAAPVAKKSAKAKKPPVPAIALTFKVPARTFRASVVEAAAFVAEDFDLRDFPAKIDDLLRTPAVHAAFAKSARREVGFLLGSLEEDDDVVDDIALVLKESFYKDLDAARTKERARLEMETATITVPRSKRAQAERLLRERGLLS